MRTPLLSLIFLLAFGGLSACNKKTAMPVGSVASGAGADRHTEEFKTTGLHGRHYATKNDCFECHTKEAPAANARASGSPVSKLTCNSCHASFPHKAGFKQGRLHGPSFGRSILKNSQGQVADSFSCARCHSGAPGKVSPSCASCHESYPHKDFGRGEVHGPAYFKNPVSCDLCHAQPRADSPVPECRSCHGEKRKMSPRNYPHSNEFKLQGKVHGPAYFEDPVSCASCHGETFRGQGNSPACAKCHDFPHAPGWALQAQHGEAFVKSQEQEGAKVTCASCHGKEKGIAAQPVIQCNACHIWHLDKPLRETSEGIHQHVLSARKWQGGCTNCHTDGKRLMPASFRGGCYACHEETKEFRVKFRDPAIEFPASDRNPSSLQKSFRKRK